MALKILLADDNINAQRMASKILTEAGYQVVAVSNGAAALKKTAAEKPDLLILDVYMPGYSGLEVCEKLKNAPDTAGLTIILTVTNMEPFNPEDGKRVKSDGLMVKPFEASDLLAMVQKFEQKLKSQPAPQYEDTVKLAVPAEFKDASYEEWKAGEPPAQPAEMAVEPQPPAPVSVPLEMAAAPALGLEEMLDETPTASLEAPLTPEPVLSPAPLNDLGPAAAPAEVTPPAELEFTSAPQVGAIEVAPAAELELTTQPEVAQVHVGQDPALVTDAADMAQFITKFGVEHPEEAAAAEPAAAPAVSDAAPPPQAVEESPLEDVFAPAAMPPPAPSSSAASLEEEMQRAFAPAAEPPEPEPILETPPPIEAIPEFSPAALPAPAPQPTAAVEPPHAEADSVTQELVAQFAAELDQAAGVAPAASPVPAVAAAPVISAPVAAAAAPAFDDQRIAKAVERVLARYTKELVDAVKLELEK